MGRGDPERSVARGIQRHEDAERTAGMAALLTLVGLAVLEGMGADVLGTTLDGMAWVAVLVPLIGAGIAFTWVRERMLDA